jgi:hypothetical protein
VKGAETSSTTQLFFKNKLFKLLVLSTLNVNINEITGTLLDADKTF